MVLSDLSLLLLFILLLPVVACDQLADGDHRRSGAQGKTRTIDIPNLELPPHILNSRKAALTNNTIWILGGLDISTTNSSASPSRNLTTIDLTNGFSIPSTFTSLTQPQDPQIPLISNGTLWSNQINKFWLFGGVSSGSTDHDNTLWRFNSSSKEQKWTQLDKKSANLTGARPADGAGCNVPSHSKGYYLGGMAKYADSSEVEYFHSMTEFDMKTEKTSVIGVPQYVPMIGQNLVFLSAGKDGVLVVLGGYTESNGVLERVSEILVEHE
ncbi:MAG: hypothetical protein Q9163_005015 [Psora crenata]